MFATAVRDHTAVLLDKWSSLKMLLVSIKQDMCLPGNNHRVCSSSYFYACVECTRLHLF
eukprot:jgi/Botrbrau1/14687/Bobra.0108s0043.1